MYVYQAKIDALEKSAAHTQEVLKTALDDALRAAAAHHSAVSALEEEVEAGKFKGECKREDRDRNMLMLACENGGLRDSLLSVQAQVELKIICDMKYL